MINPRMAGPWPITTSSGSSEVSRRTEASASHNITAANLSPRVLTRSSENPNCSITAW